MCAISEFKIKNIKYNIYGGYGGGTFSRSALSMNDDFDITYYYARYGRDINEKDIRDMRNIDALKKELNQYTKEELIAGFYDMLENFEEH